MKECALNQKFFLKITSPPYQLLVYRMQCQTVENTKRQISEFMLLTI